MLKDDVEYLPVNPRRERRQIVRSLQTERSGFW